MLHYNITKTEIRNKIRKKHISHNLQSSFNIKTTEMCKVETYYGERWTQLNKFLFLIYYIN